MRFSKMLAAAVGLSMVSAPVLAQSAAPLSLAAPASPMAGASGLTDDGYLLPAIVIVAVLAAAILLNDSEEPDNPASP